MSQLSFPFSTPVARRRRLTDIRWSPALREQWSERFARHFPDKPFRLRFNNNRSTVLSVRQRDGRLELSLHHMFVEAGPAVMAALAEYLRGGQSRKAVLDGFIARNTDRLAPTSPTRGQSRGRWYDLERIRDALGRAYFAGKLEVAIQWSTGPRRTRRKRRSIQLGSYSFEDGVVRIHPALDQEFVPACVVVAVVYHELLHFVLGAKLAGGRRMVHTREFRERERLYVHHERALRWEAAHLNRLLTKRADGPGSRRRRGGSRRRPGPSP
jgi:hypothetical protein